MIEPTRLLDLLDAERDRLAEVAAGHLDRPVPTCGDWDVADLVAHVARVFAFVEATREAGEADAPVRVPGPEPDSGVVDALRTAGDAVASGLRSAEATDPLWSWTDDRTVAFWRRRLAYETTIHRVDAELAVGLEATPVEPELAADGIDEWMTTYAVPEGRGPEPAIDGEASVHLHCTDTDGEWMLRWDAGRVALTREHGKGDVAARGPAWGLLLACYGRIDPVADETIEVFGDVELLVTAIGAA